jgi:hypothetical protein
MGLPLGPEPTPLTDADAVAQIPDDMPVRMEIDVRDGRVSVHRSDAA